MQKNPHSARRAAPRRRAAAKPQRPPVFLLVAALTVVGLIAAVVIAVTASGNAEAAGTSPVASPTATPETEGVGTPNVLSGDTALLPVADQKNGRGLVSIPPSLQTTEEIVAKRAEIQLHKLENYFVDGTYWNHFGVDVTGMSDEEIALYTTDTPCAHSANGYEYCNVYNGVMAEYFPQYDYETQCLGFASLISDLIFGLDAPVTEFYDFDALRIGDHIRLADSEHSMIVTEIDADADSVTVLEVNADYENCEITWGRTVTRDDLYATDSYVQFFTRYE